jgi:hypothetical protein
MPDWLKGDVMLAILALIAIAALALNQHRLSLKLKALESTAYQPGSPASLQKA